MDTPLICWEYPHDEPMRLSLSEPVNGNFVKLPNTVAKHEIFTGASGLLLRLWQIAPRGEIMSMEHLANLVGYSARTTRKYLATLKEAGLVAIDQGNEVRLIIPGGQPVLEDHKTIAAELDQEPARPRSSTMAERFEAIARAWDEHRPESYNLFGGKSEAVKIAIEAHMKRLRLPHDAYDEFIGAVLRGCASSEWWSQKAGMKPSGVFGLGAELEDRKFSVVENLYRSGLAEQKKVDEKFDWSDEKVKAWYHKVYPQMPVDSMTVYRTQVQTDRDAKDIESWIRNLYYEPESFYTSRGAYPWDLRVKAEVESGKIKIDEAWLNKGTIILYYSDLEKPPIYWSFRNRQEFANPPA